MEHKKQASHIEKLLKLSVVATACVLLIGCANIQPNALSQGDMQNQTRADAEAIRQNVEPLNGPLTMDEAMARALKYNLERRARMMEEALVMGQLDVSKFDMLPKITAQAGYVSRDVSRFTFSSRYPNESPSSTLPADSSTTSDREHSTRDLGLTWSMLDVGLGYYGSKQQADRFLIAGEKRRKAMHILMQDVRTAYWRAASAQLLKADVAKTIALAEEALADSRKVSRVSDFLCKRS
jgi:outer membrane protein TolC